MGTVFTPAQLGTWEETGYLHLPGFLSSVEVGELRNHSSFDHGV